MVCKVDCCDWVGLYCTGGVVPCSVVEVRETGGCGGVGDANGALFGIDAEFGDD